MAFYTEPGEANWERLYERDNWIEAVLAVDYGEANAPKGESIPPALYWLALVPQSVRLDFDTAECSLAYEGEGGYSATVWDVSGEEDIPWATLLVDVFGVRLLPEYSVLDEDAGERAIEAALERASAELPRRLKRGEFDRDGVPVVVPKWLRDVENNLWT